MNILNLKNWHKTRQPRVGTQSSNIATLLGGISITNLAYADSGLPFVTTMTKLQEAISGPFLTAAAIIMIVITCLMLAFGEWGDGFKKIINIVLWLSVAFAVTGFLTSVGISYKQ
jgi:type IV secretion system protein TrbC